MHLPIGRLSQTFVEVLSNVKSNKEWKTCSCVSECRPSDGIDPDVVCGTLNWPGPLLFPPPWKATVILTTNLPFSELTKMIPNARLCKALVDRITDQAHIIETGHDTYRFKRTALKRQATTK